MASPGGLDDLPQASVVRSKRLRISIVWIIPLLAAVVAIGIAIQRVRNEGPTITITFKGAAGIEAGKTFIKYKDVTIGQVTTVELTNDYSKVEVTAQIAKHAEGLIVEDAKFWVVQPQVSLSGVSGLSTLLSGQYIGFQAGTSQKREPPLHRARRAAGDDGSARPALHAHRQEPGIGGNRRTDLLSKRTRRRGRGIRAGRRRQLDQGHRIHQRPVSTGT